MRVARDVHACGRSGATDAVFVGCELLVAGRDGKVRRYDGDGVSMGEVAFVVDGKSIAVKNLAWVVGIKHTEFILMAVWWRPGHAKRTASS